MKNKEHTEKSTAKKKDISHSSKKTTTEIEKLSARIAELESTVAQQEKTLIEVNEKYLRLAADYDNYRKRREKEFADIIEYAGEEVLRNILPILDDLERAFNNLKPEGEEQSLREGLELIYRKFQKTLQNLGVEPIESLSQPFDPYFHHAVMTREASDVAPDIVVEEFEKGYKYKNHVLRHSKVVVSK
ncbi:MAG: nucleotide exchange factor GrpE [Candidatus Neomarinimicrobiota bacterium]|nr:nucleotide exchange factor GrpE [Candidatus Neomarinimicrobiota bacterium]